MIKNPKNPWVSRHSPANCAPFVRMIRRVYRLLMHYTMGSIESVLTKKNVRLQFAPIFIIGVPRSGTTLLYQIMTTALKLCFFNNLMRIFYECPVLISLFTLPMGGNKATKNFASYYGNTSGWSDPYQGEGIWWRWFPQDPCYVGSGFLNYTQQQQLRRTISLMEHIFRVPFVNKWPVNSVRIIPLSEVFPEAVFIRVNRDPVMVAQSLLHGRREYLGDVGTWISTKPSNFENIKSESNIDQVCEQIFYIEQDIDRDSKIVGIERFLDIEYEELCNSPVSAINKIKQFYASTPSGCVLSNLGDPPKKMSESKNMKVSLDEYKSIEICLNKLYEDN